MKNHIVCEEPYRLFFPLGVLMGIIGVGHWLAFAAGWTHSYSAFYHSSIQMQAYMSCFVLGFLLTAMPRFASAPHATPVELFLFAGLILAISIFLALGKWVASEICFMALLLSLARFAVKRFKARKSSNPNPPPLEFIWIPIAILHGLMGTGLLIAGQTKNFPPWAIAVGKPMEEQGFLLSIVLGVGGFLAPRLMGRYQVIKPAEVEKMKGVPSVRIQRIWIHAAAGMALFLSFCLEGVGVKVPAYCLRAIVVTVMLFWNRTLPFPPKVPDLFVKLLWISFWMVAAGSWGIAIFPQYRTAMLHLVLISGFSLMTFAVGTMVTLSHSGQSAELRKPLWVLKLVGLGVGFAAFIRLAAVFFPASYFIFLGFAAACWIAGGVGWLFFVAPRIVKIPQFGEFEKSHEEAKQRIIEIKQEECCVHHAEGKADPHSCRKEEI